MDIFDEFKKLGKRPVIAKIGGFRPDESIMSWFGGNFLIEEGLLWPQCHGNNMLPVIQMCISEIPRGKEYFGDIEIVQVFMNKDKLPNGGLVKNGDGWLLRTYSMAQNLMIVQTPDDIDKFKTFPIKWYVEENDDYPCWEESWKYHDMSVINEDDALTERFFEEFNSYMYTKIGGYASYIQSPCEGDYEYIFQISSEEKPRFMVGDNGKLYFLKSKLDGEWYLHWDCY